MREKERVAGVSLLISAILTVSAYAEEYKLDEVKVSIKFDEIAPEGLVENIPQEELSKLLNSDLGVALYKELPDVSFIRKGATANEINLRGFSRDNLNFIFDDMFIQGACPNRMDPPISHVSINNIENVELMRGPFNVEYSGSLGGYVKANLIQPQTGTYGKGTLTVGSFNYVNGNLTFNYGTEKFKILTSLSKSYSRAYESGEGKYFTEYPTGSAAYKEIKKTAFDISDVLIKTELNPDNENQIKLHLGYNYSKDVLYPYLLMDAMYDMTYQAGLTYSNKVAKVKGLVYFNSVKHDMRDTFRVSSNMALPGYDYGMRTLAKTKTSGFRLTKDFNLYGTDFKVGIDGYLKNWKADNWIGMMMMGNPVQLDNRGMIPDVDIRNLGVFIKGDKKVEKFVISGGLRFDYVEYDASKSAFGTSNYDLYSEYYRNYDYSSSDKFITGNMLLTYKMNKKSDFYIGYGHSARVPNQEELYIALRKPMTKADWVGNPNLAPTKNDEIDLGMNYRQDLTSIKVNLFYSKLTDYIYLTKIPNLVNPNKYAMSYKNLDAHIYGGNVEILQDFNNGFYGKAGLAYQKGEKDNGYTTDSDLVEIPPLKLMSGLGYKKGNLDMYLEGIYSAKQKDVDEELNEFTTSPYFVMNLRTSYNTDRFAFTFGVDNIFDTMYYTYLSYKRDPFSSGVRVPEPGRFIYMSVGLTY